MAAFNWRGQPDTPTSPPAPAKQEDQNGYDSLLPTFGRKNSYGLPNDPLKPSLSNDMMAVETWLRRMTDQLRQLQQQSEEQLRRQQEMEKTLTRKLEQSIERASSNTDKQHGEKDKVEHLIGDFSERNKAAIESLGFALQSNLESMQAKIDVGGLLQKLEGLSQTTTARTEVLMATLGQALQVKMDNHHTNQRNGLEKVEKLLAKSSEGQGGQELLNRLETQTRQAKDMESNLTQRFDALTRQGSEGSEASRELNRTLLTKMESLQMQLQTSQVRKGLDSESDAVHQAVHQVESIVAKIVDRSADRTLQNLEAAVSKAKSAVAEQAVAKALERTSTASDNLAMTIQSKLDSLLNMHARRQADRGDATTDVLRGIQSKFDMQATHLQHLEGVLSRKVEESVEHCYERLDDGVQNIRIVLENVAVRSENVGETVSESVSRQMETLVDIRRLSMMVLENASAALTQEQPTPRSMKAVPPPREEDMGPPQQHNPWPPAQERRGFGTPRHTSPPVLRDLAEDMHQVPDEPDGMPPPNRWQPRPDSASATKNRKVFHDGHIEQNGMAPPMRGMAGAGSRPGSAHATKTKASSQWNQQGGGDRLPPPLQRGTSTSDKVEDMLKKSSARYGMHTFAG